MSESKVEMLPDGAVIFTQTDGTRVYMPPTPLRRVLALVAKLFGLKNVG